MRAVAVTCIFSMLFCITFLSTVGFSSSTDGVAVYWELTGSNHIDLLTRSHVLAVNVTNYGSAMAGCDVSISSEYGKLGLSPLSQRIVSIPLGLTKPA